jgi:hypothetical protein
MSESRTVIDLIAHIKHLQTYKQCITIHYKIITQFINNEKTLTIKSPQRLFP